MYIQEINIIVINTLQISSEDDVNIKIIISYHTFIMYLQLKPVVYLKIYTIQRPVIETKKLLNLNTKPL